MEIKSSVVDLCQSSFSTDICKLALLEKINNRTAQIGILGLGYVGLPLIHDISEIGFKVLGFDINKEKVTNLTHAKSDVTTVTIKDLRKILNYNVKFFSQFDNLYSCDIIIICVPTPIDTNNVPDLSCVLNALDNICKFAQDTVLLIIESTIAPGTIDEIIAPYIKLNMHKNRTIFIAYSPERIDPGNERFSNKNIPKIISGINKQSTELADVFYSLFINKTIIVSSCKVAEATKVFENTFRYINIAFVNEMKIIFDKMGIDIWEVIKLAQTKPFGYMPFYPGPGIGGHCIPVDPFYLVHEAIKNGVNSSFIKVSSEVIKLLSDYIVNKTIQAIFHYQSVSIHNANILLVGMSYKENIADVRHSPTIDIFNYLKSKEAIIDYYDPYIPLIEINNHQYNSLIFTDIDFAKYNAVLLLTKHHNINYQKIFDTARIVVDSRNISADYTTESDVKIIKA